MAMANVGAIALYTAKMESPTRNTLETLAGMCGLSAAHQSDASFADLLALHRTVMVKPDSGYSVADRIARKLEAASGRGSPTVFDPIEPTGPTTPQGGLPDVLNGPAKADLDSLKDWVRRLAEASKERHEYQAERNIEFNDRIAKLAEGLDTMAMQIATDLADQITGAVQTALDAMSPTNLVVKLPMLEPTAVGLVHFATPRIIRALAGGLNVYLHGPAGSGKTTVGRKCAEAFSLKFYTAAKVESEYLLLGFKDAQGNTVRTQFREAYEHGGVFLFDEMDASSPGAIVALNMALANGMCPFPDGIVERHKDFKCLGAGNTTLTGANRQYVGRTQLDAASVDRFYFVEFPYDEVLETTLATNKDWCKHVQAIRHAVAERGLNHLVTPRATFDGCKALDIGDTWEEAEAACVFKGLDADTVEQIKRSLPAKRNAALDPIEPTEVIQGGTRSRWPSGLTDEEKLNRLLNGSWNT